jgi:hypothetical protein
MCRRFSELEVPKALRSMAASRLFGVEVLVALLGQLGAEPTEARCWGPFGVHSIWVPARRLSRLEEASSVEVSEPRCQGPSGRWGRGSWVEVAQALAGLGRIELYGVMVFSPHVGSGRGLFGALESRSGGGVAVARRADIREGSKSSCRLALSETRGLDSGSPTRWRRDVHVRDSD